MTTIPRDGLAKFCDVYEKNLRQCVIEHPTEYVYPLSEVPMVVNRMMIAFGKMSFNKEGRAIKNTCKELGIAYTYKAMKEFFDSGRGY